MRVWVRGCVGACLSVCAWVRRHLIETVCFLAAPLIVKDPLICMVALGGAVLVLEGFVRRTGQEVET